MPIDPLWAHEAQVPAETWSSRERGEVTFRTLFGGAAVLPRGLTAGVCDIEPGQRLETHSHAPAEIYYVLQGRCSVAVASDEQELRAGGSVLIPGHAPHAVTNVGDEPLRIFYVLAAESMADVEYHFDGEQTG